MRTVFRRAFGRVGSAVALSLAVLTLAACGSAAQPDNGRAAADGYSQAAAAPTTAADATPALLRAAPKVRTARHLRRNGKPGLLHAGNKNVVVVFYRGFW